MSYLSYHRRRRDHWKEHDSFPVGAVRYYRDPTSYRTLYQEVPLLIFRVSDDRKIVTLIPEEDWPVE